MKSTSNSLLLFALLVAVSFTCNKYKAPNSLHDIEDRRTSREARYNLLGFPGDDSVITADVPAADDSVREESDMIAFPENSGNEDSVTEAFSVHLFASKSSEEAEQFQQDVESLFDEIVVTDYRAPYYKVRVGEIPTLEEGEALLDKVKGMGFPNAWLVRIRY